MRSRRFRVMLYWALLVGLVVTVAEVAGRLGLAALGLNVAEVWKKQAEVFDHEVAGRGGNSRLLMSFL